MPAYTASTRRKTSAVLLPIAFILTLVLGTFNAFDEQNGLRLTVIGALGSVVSQIPGLILIYVCYRRRSTALTILLFAAYFVAITGLIAYIKYATDGKADSLNSAAQMHIVLFPLLHCFVAFFAYVAAGIVAILVAIVSSANGIRNAEVSDTVEYCSICKKDVNTDDDHRCLECRWPI